MSNTVLEILTGAIVLAHLAALVVAVRARGLTAIVWLAGVGALPLLVYAALRLPWIVASADTPFMAMVAFEVAVLAAVVAGLRGHRVARFLCSVAFGLHGLAAIAAATVILTFRMRLF